MAGRSRGSRGLLAGLIAGLADPRLDEHDRAEARLRDFVETGSHWYWETDADHRFSYLSEDIRSFGHAPINVIGRGRWEFACDLDSEPEKWRQHLATLARHEPFRDFVYRRRSETEGERFSAVSGKPVFDRGGRFVGYRGSARDITAERQAERELREAKLAAEAANLAKSEFLTSMSHELRTPLNAILGFSEMLELGVAGPLAERQQEYVALIRQSGTHLLEVIGEILDLAKVDAGKLELHEEQGLDPGRLAESCVALVRGHANAASLRLELAITEPIPPMIADPTRLKQILLNLLSNAVKFSPAGGLVRLTLGRAADGRLEFVVADDGPGMTPAEIAIALEPFGQVHRGRRCGEGTGLGLPLARRLAELHGGSLAIDSQAGCGTRIAVRLPARRMLACSAEPVASEIPA